jgi:hypothetical protein
MGGADEHEQRLIQLADNASRRRVVYGARCMWWDTIDKASSKPSGLPCCPHCGGVLMEMPDIEGWYIQAKKYEDDGHPGYVERLRWSQGKCFPNTDALQQAFEASSMS